MEAYRQTHNEVNKLNIKLKRELFTNKVVSQNDDFKSAGILSIWFLVRSLEPPR